MSAELRPPSRTAKLGLVLFGVTVALLAGEALVRATRGPYDDRIRAFADAAVVPDAALSHRLRPGARVVIAGIEYRVSSLGTRGPEPADAPAFRVVVLGDSVTMGWGVAEDDTWPARVGASLASRAPDIEMIDAAVLGWGIEEHCARFDELARSLDPDLVIVGYFPNDPEGTDAVVAGRGLRSELFALLAARLASASGTSRATEHERALHAEGSPGWATVQRSFTRLGARCREEHIPCAIALLPSLTESPYPLQPEHRRLA
ncbi:MAG: hypothetical protein M3Y87_13465, partial [Myxococcota bacterium]|nr:hypothetical protein [Myxococcota bacterium]